MKKRLLLITLLIVAIIMTGNVNALDSTFNGSIIMDGAFTINTGSSWMPTYTSHKFTLKVGSEEYKAYCIRPGKGASHINPVTCTELDPTRYGMTYSAAQDQDFNEHQDEYTKDIIYRTLGIMDRASDYFESTGGHYEGAEGTKVHTFFVVQWHHYMVFPKGDIANDVDASHVAKIATNDTFVNAFNIAREKYYDYWMGRPADQRKYATTGTTVNSLGIRDNGENHMGSYFAYVKKQVGNKTIYTFYHKNLPYPGCYGSPAAEGVEISITGLSNAHVTREWNGCYAEVTVEQGTGGSGCNGEITIQGHMNSREMDIQQSTKKVYLCQMLTGGTSRQAYVAFAPGRAGDKFRVTAKCDDCIEQNSSDEYDSNSEHTCTDAVDSDYYKDSEVHNCCLDSRESKLEEYSLNELFCSEANSKIKAEYFTNKCYNKGYHDEVIWTELKSTISITGDTESVEQFCQVRCTERMKITLPDHIISATGKYFKMTPQATKYGTETTGPIIDGTKRCTIKVDYQKARRQYQVQINGKDGDRGEIQAFNDYQTDKAWCDVTDYNSETRYVTTNATTFVLKKEWDTCTTNSKHVGKGGSYTDSDGKSQTCSSDDGCDVTRYVKSGETYYEYNGDGACSSGKTCEKNADGTTTGCETYANKHHVDRQNSVRETCTQHYTVYTLKGTAAGIYTPEGTNKYAIDYFHVKKNADFNYSADKTSWPGLTITRKSEGADGTASWVKVSRTGSSGDCVQKINAAKNAIPGYEYESGDTSYKQFNGTDASISTSTPVSKHSDSCSAATSDSTQFNTKKTRASNIENIVYGCSNFFDGIKNGDKGDQNNKFYKLTPTATFHYMQIILEGANSKRAAEGQLDYTADCKIEFKQGDDTGNDAGTKYIDSTRYGATSENMIDLGELKRLLKADPVPTDDRSQKLWATHVRYNAYYEAYCTFNPPDGSDGTVTVYPTPMANVASMSGTIGDSKTGHKYQYAIYLTAFSGQFETYWRVTGLGGANKTIAKFTKAFNSISTCAEDGLNYSYNNWAESERNATTVPFTCDLSIIDGGMRIGYCDFSDGIDTSSDFRKCDKHVQNVYEFRVVDPAKLFPSSSSSGNIWENKADNWKKSKNGPWRDIVTNIQDHAKEAYSTDYLSYQFKINPKSIKAIKDYNKTKAAAGETYADASVKCECETTVDSGNCGTIDADPSCKDTSNFKYSCWRCESDFLNALAGSAGDGNGGQIGTTHFTEKIWQRYDDKTIKYVRDHKAHWSR